jgi:hypothetical protein
MPVYMCRWHSGDISFVSANNKEDAIFKLDEVGNAETCPLIKVPDFMIHLKLEDDGELHLSEDPFGDSTQECVSELAYPVLNELGAYPSPEQLRQAVERERTRLVPGPAPKPQSATGRSVKEFTGAATVVIERLQQRAEAERLKRKKGTKPKRPDR